MDKPSASRTNNDKCLFLLQKNCIDLTSPVCESRQVYVIECNMFFFSSLDCVFAAVCSHFVFFTQQKYHCFLILFFVSL